MCPQTIAEAGDFLYTPPGTTHRVWTFDDSFGVCGVVDLPCNAALVERACKWYREVGHPAGGGIYQLDRRQAMAQKTGAGAGTRFVIVCMCGVCTCVCLYVFVIVHMHCVCEFACLCVCVVVVDSMHWMRFYPLICRSLLSLLPNRFPLGLFAVASCHPWSGTSGCD